MHHLGHLDSLLASEMSGTVSVFMSIHTGQGKKFISDVYCGLVLVFVHGIPPPIL